jgi:hypothetical protein
MNVAARDPPDLGANLTADFASHCITTPILTQRVSPRIMRCAGRPTKFARFGLCLCLVPARPRADLAREHTARSGGIRCQFAFDSNEGGFFEIDAFLDHLRQPLFDTLGAM